MKVLRGFPRLAAALRDGRVCLTTLALLGQVLTEENAEDLLTRAAYRTAAEVDHLVASLRPRQAPREGLRQLPGPVRTAPPQEAQAATPPPPVGSAPDSREPVTSTPACASPPLVLDAPRSRTAEMRAVSEGQWSLRVTVDRSLKDDLETLAALLSHKVRKGDLAAVLHEAIRCGIEKHGKRKGAVKPARKVEKAPPPRDPAAVSAELRRQVWERDQGRCAWVSQDGRRCRSRWQVEVDHVDPVARGGKATLDRVRLLCKAHNLLHAEQVYGREPMRKYRKGESSTSGDSSRSPPMVREACATG